MQSFSQLMTIRSLSPPSVASKHSQISALNALGARIHSSDLSSWSRTQFPFRDYSSMITQPLIPNTLLLDQKLSIRSRVALPASWMRCGTSKGLFIQRQYLPHSPNDWRPWLLAAMGSKGEDIKQLDGIGGATSTTSKVAIVSPSSKPGIDVEYTFAQVGVGKEIVDFTGNCGNIASGVGPFAIEQGIVNTIPGQKQVDVRILNTNTNSMLVETVQLDPDGFYQESGDYCIAGIASSGSEIKVTFLDPAGTMTSRLFPSGRANDTIRLRASDSIVKATLIDAGNPFVLVDGSSLPFQLTTESLKMPPRSMLDTLESIRRQAAVVMGLATDAKQASQTRGTPKIAIMLETQEAGSLFECSGAEIAVISLSMGKIHPTLQLTGSVAIASALSIRETVAAQLSASRKQGGADLHDCQNFKIAHQGGCIEVAVQSNRRIDGAVDIESCSISRTARTLFEGQVLFRL